MVEKFETQVIGNGPAALSVPLSALTIQAKRSCINDIISKQDLQTNQVIEALRHGGIGEDLINEVSQNISGGAELSDYAQEELQQLELETEMCLIGPESSFGSGNLGYAMKSNSAASDFLEPVIPFFLDQVNRQVVEEIKYYGDAPVCLKKVAKFQKALAQFIFKTLEEKQERKSFFDTQVSKIQEDESGRLISFDQSGNPLVSSENAIISIGAHQELLNLEQNHEKRILSDDFLRFSPSEIEAKVKGKKIAVIGGAHSALSCIDNIRQINQKSPIKLFHRNGFKLYFESTDLAKQAGITDNISQCLDTGKINRFDGIRGAAQDRYLGIQADEEPKTEIIQYSGDVSEILSPLGEADIIIQATGYKPKTIPIYNKEGELVHQNPVDESESFQPLILGKGQIFYNGIAVTPRDGINLFQQSFAESILSKISSLAAWDIRIRNSAKYC